MSDPFDTIREAIEALRHERVTRSPIAPTGDVSDALAALAVLKARELRLAQGLRLIRDTTSEYPSTVARVTLEEAGVPDPPDEEHP